jgi:hypothetical protein
MSILAFVSSSAVISAVKAAQPPPFDARLTDPIWQTAVEARDFENFTVLRAASAPTIAFLLYDDRNLYVGFRCTQSGTPIVAAQTIDNGSVAGDDHVTIWIDPSGNGARTYSFSASPRGVRSETSSENARYAPPWSVKTQVADGNYSVMMVIPLSDIRASGSRRWRINFERYTAALNEDDTWAFQNAQTSVSSPQYWPTLSGIQIAGSATHPKPYADIYGLASAGSQHNIFEDGIGEFQPTAARNAGIDATIPFTSTLAFVGTLNPDFSNVEEDQTTIAPQEFQKAYAEYRPFFAQGAQYIDTLPQPSLVGSANTMFYTPSIGIFNRGLKVEGTSGRNAVGVLNVVGPDVDDNAFGYAYAVPDNSFTASTEGVLANHDGTLDNTYGVAFTQTNPHSGQFTQLQAQSESGSLVTTPGTAQTFILDEGLRNQHFVVQGLYDDIGPEYAPIDGYTAINDLKGVGTSVEYLGVGPKTSPIQSYSVTMFADRYFDGDNNVRQADINGFFTLNFKNLLSVTGFAGPSELRTYQQGYPYYVDGQTDWYNRRQLTLNYAASSSSPIQVSYTYGPFGGYYVQQTGAALSHVVGPYSVSLTYDGNIERLQAGSPIIDSQWLRDLTFSRSFGRDASVALSYRNINGTGGFATPGANLAMLYQQRFANQDMLYLEYGTPAAVATLHRFIAKYVFHVGGGTGT